MFGKKFGQQYVDNNEKKNFETKIPITTKIYNTSHQCNIIFALQYPLTGTR